MRAVLATMAGLLLAAVLVPTVAAHESPEAVYRFTAPGEAVGHNNVSLPTDASWHLLDRFDRDGDDRIDAGEADEMETFVAESSEDADASTAWDGKAPVDSEVTDLALPDVEGPMHYGEQVHVHASSELSYEAEDELANHVWVRATDDVDEDRRLTVEAPPGHVVGSHEGLNGAEISDDGTQLEGTTSQDEDVVVVFAAQSAGQESHETPGLGLAGALAATLGALAVARRA